MKVERLRPLGKRWGIRGRPLNCDLSLKEDARCPNCNQVHMRPGYCQALDPVNAAKYPHFHPSHVSGVSETESQNDETETVHETGQSQPWIAAGVSRATYFRKRRAQGEAQD